MNIHDDMRALAETIEDSYQSNIVQDLLLDEADRRLIVTALYDRADQRDTALTRIRELEHLSLSWSCWAQALFMMNDKRAERLPEWDAQAAAYKKCAEELTAALSSKDQERTNG